LAIAGLNTLESLQKTGRNLPSAHHDASSVTSTDALPGSQKQRHFAEICESSPLDSHNYIAKLYLADYIQVYVNRNCDMGL